MSEEMTDSQDDLPMYAAWKKIYPKHQPGFFRSLRWGISSVLLGIFFLTPFLRWERMGAEPDQAILLDLPARKFHFFNLVIWPQDIFLLAFLLIFLTIALFFITALAGRVFCGYFCFQSIWTDLFLLVERWVEGDRGKRMRFDAAPWGVGKLQKKLVKHAIWLLISLLTGWAFVAYFMDVYTLTAQLFAGTAPYAAWFTIGFLTLTTYTFAGFAREQTCIYMCPYARFQGVMFDQDTLIVAYDEPRGEPRMANRRQRRMAGTQAGDCIDCGECVRVCYMGIDIRDGQQYECTTCAACIDACDQVMDRVKKPHGLIKYTSMHAMQGGVTRFLRLRVAIYALLLLIGLGIMVGYLLMRNTVDMNVMRYRSPIYIQQSNGSIQNNYTVRVLNLTDQPHSYALSMSGLPDAQLEVAAITEKSAQGEPVLRIAPGDVVPYTLYVRQPPLAVGSGRIDVRFTLRALEADGGVATYDSVFMRP